MARVFGVRLVVILGFAFTVVLVQIIAVSRLGSYSQEFFKEEEQKFMHGRKPTTSLEHEDPKQVVDVVVEDVDVLAGAVDKKERPAGRVPVAVTTDDKRTDDKQTTERATRSETTTKKAISTETTTERATSSETAQKSTSSEATTQATTLTTEAKEVSTEATTVKVHATNKPVFCDITNGDALSAITRASTIACKNMIKNVTCLAQEGKLYNMDVPNLCTLGTNPGVAVESLSFSKDKDSSVRILFLLSLHGRSVRQVKRLFKAIYDSKHYYYIHVDSRSDYLYREMKHFLKYPNVALTPWQLATIWGGASLLQMLLRAIEDVDRRTDWEWDFFINLSESDYPVQTNKRLESFLSANKDKNFVKTHGRDVNRFIQKQGLDRTFVECDNHMWRVGNRPLPKDVTIDGGSDWIAINRRYAHYLVTGDDNLLIRIKRIFEFSLLPAEAFFHTVIRNGHFCDTFIRTNLRITNWKRKLGCRCQYKHIVDWCGCSPNDFLTKDLSWLKSPGEYNFFARKFEAIVSQEIITLLDAHLYGAWPDDTPALHDYWESVYHMMDDITMPTDAQYTAYMSFVRIAHQRLRNITEKCVPPSTLQEVSVYRHKDAFVGMVITMEEASSTYEALFTPIEHSLHLAGQNEATKRLLHIEVSSVWDEKESIFRNYAGLVGPGDDIVLVMHWVLGSATEAKNEWYDPTGELTFSHRTKVEAHLVVSFTKPNLVKPLRPGVWSVRVLVANQLTMETSFLVVPLSHKDKKLMDKPESINAARMTESHHNTVTDEAFDHWRNGVILSGPPLMQFIDEQVLQFWTLKSLCGPPSCTAISQCKGSSDWSTLSPDPKSELNDVNNIGLLRHSTIT